MRISYPLYVLELDDHSFRQAEEGALSHFEAIDVDDGLYRCWDSKGLPVMLVSGENGVCAVVTSEVPEIESFRSAVEKYALSYAGAKIPRFCVGPDEMLKVVSSLIA